MDGYKKYFRFYTGEMKSKDKVASCFPIAFLSIFQLQKLWQFLDLFIKGDYFLKINHIYSQYLQTIYRTHHILVYPYNFGIRFSIQRSLWVTALHECQVEFVTNKMEEKWRRFFSSRAKCALNKIPYLDYKVNHLSFCQGLTKLNVMLNQVNSIK